MNPERFEAEALDHLDALYRYALRLARQPERAEDLVQETYARALAARDRFERQEAIRPTLFRILYNLFVDQWRSEHGLNYILVAEASAGEVFAQLARKA